MSAIIDTEVGVTSDVMATQEESFPEPLRDADDQTIQPEAIVEALLLASDEPLPPAKLALLLGRGDVADIKEYVANLNQRYEAAGASFRIEAIAKGYQILTLPIYDRWVQKLHKARADSRLSAAALETLAIVAYKQPVLRADVEAIRGVAVGDMLVRLREMNLVRIVGRAEEIGRPLLYGTTNRFLEVFGLGSLKDLPKLDDDRAPSLPPLRVVAEPPE
jgi:segregation and condensation protein B